LLPLVSNTEYSCLSRPAVLKVYFKKNGKVMVPVLSGTGLLPEALPHSRILQDIKVRHFSNSIIEKCPPFFFGKLVTNKKLCVEMHALHSLDNQNMLFVFHMQMNSDVSQWSVEDCGLWLDSIGLEISKGAFRG
jgi:hypothetical protein